MPQLPENPPYNAAEGGALDGRSSGGNAARAPGVDSLRLIAFGLGNEWYAVEIQHVRGIEQEREITCVPRGPKWLAGVFNLHGTILPAIDPRPLLGISPQRKREAGLLIVFQWDGNQAALLADGVDEIYELSRSSLEPQLATVAGPQAGLLQGNVRVRDRLIGVIDLPALVDVLLKG